MIERCWGKSPSVYPLKRLGAMEARDPAEGPETVINIRYTSTSMIRKQSSSVPRRSKLLPLSELVKNAMKYSSTAWFIDNLPVTLETGCPPLASRCNAKMVLAGSTASPLQPHAAFSPTMPVIRSSNLSSPNTEYRCRHPCPTRQRRGSHIIRESRDDYGTQCMSEMFS